MERRLRLAWEILADTGSIFISIDDFENATLRLLCDEIFGEANFLCTLVWQKRYSRENREAIGDAHEYILVYTKNKEWFKENRHMVDVTDSIQKAYKNPNNDPKGRWRGVPMTAQGWRPNQMYPITDPKGNVHYPPEGRCWSTIEPEYRKLLEAGRIYFGKNNDSQPSIIRYLSEVNGATPWTWWPCNEVGHTDEAKKELFNIIGKANNFDTPKPSRLVRQILKIASHNNDLILDFFAGSGTTGQAVLELNREDGGNRRFILCTNNENQICENVTYPRIKTVITGVRTNGSEYSDGIPANLKYYRTDFVQKSKEDMPYDLLNHIREMIQLEHGIDLDQRQYVLLLDDEDADELEETWNEYPELKGIYMSSDVLLTGEQQQLFGSVELNIIPEYYFESELREAGQTL